MADVFKTGKKGRKVRQRNACRRKDKLSKDIAFKIQREKQQQGHINIFAYGCSCGWHHVGHMVNDYRNGR